MSAPSKKHHFVTQAQLRYFAADTERSFLFVFDKQKDRSFQSSILNAGSENHFNTVSFGDIKWNFEDLFREVDSRSAILVANIISRESLAWLTPNDCVTLADLFSTQLLRTRFSRTTPEHMASRLREMIRQVGYDPDLYPEMAMPSDAALRLGAVKAFLERGGHTASLLRLHPALYATSPEQPFIISDHPVSLDNPFPYGDLGLTSHGIVVMLPISPSLTIVLHCPTIVDRYELASNMNLESGKREQMQRHRDGLRSGESIKVESNTVLWLNKLQVARSARYLYAAKDDFNFAREILREQPNLRTVDTHINFGEIGSAPPPRSRMPAGTRLVIFGRADHCMLEIEEIDEAGEGITARTKQVDLLNQVAADSGSMRVELYVDQQVKCMKGEVTIERFGQPSDGWFRVVDRDPSLRALSTQLDEIRRRRQNLNTGSD